MMMNSENYYKNLTEKELRILINANDDRALNEFTRRCEIGKIKRVTYTLDQMDEMIAKLQKRKVN